MSEQNDPTLQTEPAQAAQQATQEPPNQAEPNGAAGTEPNGKADDAAYWKTRSRNWEKQFKDLKATADENAAAKQAAIDEARRADDAEAALAAANRELSVLRAASEAGVDAAVLARMTGDTPEEIAANASMLAESIKASQAYPAVVDNGSRKPQPMTLSDIDAIEDDALRRAAYADYYARNRK